MKAISKETKTYKLFTALQEGEKLTAAQAKKLKKREAKMAEKEVVHPQS